MAKITKGKGFTYSSNIPDILVDVGKAIQETVNTTAVNIHSDAVKNASGRPGPNVDTGNLRNKIKPNLAVSRSLRASVSSLAPYSIYLEFGTKKMQPYPFFRKAALANVEKFTLNMIAILRRVVRDGSFLGGSALRQITQSKGKL